MFIYFTILSILVLSLFIPRKISSGIHFFVIFIMFGIYIGLREKVGGDWFQYLDHYNQIASSQLSDVLFSLDIGYVMINSFSSLVGGGIYLTNFISAIIFLYGLSTLIKIFNLKLSLSLFIAYPYLITIIAMGYTRQAIAMGFVMLLLVALKNKKIKKAIGLLLLAMLFHKTAIFAFVFFIEGVSLVWILMGIILTGSIYIVFSNLISIMYRVYFLESMQSSGGIVRLLLLTVVSSLFFYFRKEWRVKYSDDYLLVRKMAYLSFIFLALALITNATTLFDRISLYIYPLQIIILNRVLFLEKNQNIKFFYFLGIICLYVALLCIWMFYGLHAHAWTPYDNILLKAF